MKPLILALLLTLTVPSLAHAQADKTLWWTGLGLSAGGGILSLVGAYGMRKTECEVTVVLREQFVSCYNKPNYPIVFTGAGLAVAGSVMMAVGARQSIAIGPRSITYIRRF